MRPDILIYSLHFLQSVSTIDILGIKLVTYAYITTVFITYFRQHEY